MCISTDNSDYTTISDLGVLYGVSRVVFGKWLKEIGLRTEDGKPSHVAFDGDYVIQTPTGRNDGYFYIWHERKTVAAVDAARKEGKIGKSK